MSRIGKRPITLPDKVTIDIKGQYITVKGPKGSLERELPSRVQLYKEVETLMVQRQDDSRISRERH